MKKTIIIILVILAVIAALVYFGSRFAVGFVFDKMYTNVLNEMIEKEKEKESNSNAPKNENDISEQNENPSANNEEENGEGNPKNETGTSGKKTDIAVKKLSELTSQELAEIQALITQADKNAAIAMVKSALTVEDKREIKKMLETGNIDYARCKQILAQRLNSSQKKQIYAYYEKYSTMYFSMKSGN